MAAGKSSGSSEGGWQRPDDPDYPHEWDHFEGVHPMPDGRLARFWIRDLTPDMEEEVVAQMHTHFVTEEPTAVATRLFDDPQSLGEMESLWRDTVSRQRVSLAAFTDWPDGKQHLAGLNLLGVVLKTDAPMMMDGRCTRPLLVLMNEMFAAADLFERYGVDRYMVGLGLSVRPEFRGQGVGLRLLRAREPLCAALRLPLTITMFSGAQSQKQARRAGFELLESRTYADFVIEGERPFKDATWTHMEVQGKYYGLPDEAK